MKMANLKCIHHWPFVIVLLALHSFCEMDTELWSPDELMEFAQRVSREVAELHVEVAWLRKELHKFRIDNITGTREEIADDAMFMFEEPSSARLATAMHGRTLFVTMCVGLVHFHFYCGPFLASFERAYRAAAKNHRVLVFFADVDMDQVRYASARFAPWAHFKALPEWLGIKPLQEVGFDCTADNRHCDTVKSATEDKSVAVAKNNAIFPRIVAEYLAIDGQGFCHTVIIDSDTLFVRPLGTYLHHCDSSSGINGLPQFRENVDHFWDVAFTTYDSDFRVPWATDAEHVGRTRSGLTRINSGVILINLANISRVCRFLFLWSEVCLGFAVGDFDGFSSVDDHQRDWFLTEFKAPAQASLAALVSSLDIERMQTLLGWADMCKICKETVEVGFHDDAGGTHLRMRALPARVLNHAESMLQGSFTSDLLVTHLKGMWWRALLTHGGTPLSSPTRTLRWNRDSLILHGLCLDIWESSLGKPLH